jgi:hypothetical protein
MRTSISIGISGALAAVFTHGLVSSAMYFDQDLPPVTYQGFFQQILLATERLWSHAHGWQPLSHIRDFGHFYAPVVQLVGPLVGFALFWITSRHKVGIDFWKPVGIALLMGIPPLFNFGSAEPWVQAFRTVVIVMFMVWSVGAVPNPKPA